MTLNTSATPTPLIESVTPAPLVTRNPVIVSEDAAVPTHVARYAAPAPAVPIPHIQEEIVAEETTQVFFLRLFVLVTQASTPGGLANARSFALATGNTRDSSMFSNTICAKMITVLTRYRPIVLELI